MLSRRLADYMCQCVSHVCVDAPMNPYAQPQRTAGPYLIMLMTVILMGLFSPSTAGPYPLLRYRTVRCSYESYS